MPDESSSPTGTPSDPKKVRLFFCRPINEDVERAQQWLVTGTGQIPSVTVLACTVNGYERYREVEELSAWARTNLLLVTSGRIELLSTQDLLDLLFYFNRAERFVEGTFDAHASEIDSIIVEISRRVSPDDHGTPPSTDRDDVGNDHKPVYTVLELLGKRPTRAWLRGDFILIQRAGNRAVLRSRVETAFSVNGKRVDNPGSTLVNVTVNREINELSSDGLITFPESDPLRVLSVGKDAQANMVVEAEF